MAYLTADELRERVETLADEAKFPDATLEEHVSAFEALAERYIGVAYETRTATETHHFTADARYLGLEHIEVTDITSLTVNGSDVDATSYTLDPKKGEIWMTISPGALVAVEYEHGLTDPIPPELLFACRDYVRARALAERSKLPRDVVAQSAEGLITRFSTPDWKAGRPTGYLDIDATLNNLRDTRVGIG